MVINIIELNKGLKRRFDENKVIRYRKTDFVEYLEWGRGKDDPTHKIYYLCLIPLGKLYVSGDYGNATYAVDYNKDLEFWNSTGTQYFTSKCVCWDPRMNIEKRSEIHRYGLRKCMEQKFDPDDLSDEEFMETYL